MSHGTEDSPHALASGPGRALAAACLMGVAAAAVLLFAALAAGLGRDRGNRARRPIATG